MTDKYTGFPGAILFVGLVVAAAKSPLVNAHAELRSGDGGDNG